MGSKVKVQNKSENVPKKEGKIGLKMLLLEV